MQKKVVAKAFVWPDTHYPYHDPQAVGAALRALEGFAPDKLFIIGDFFDCYSMSFYPKSPTRLRLLKDELAAGVEALARIKKIRKKTRPKKSEYKQDVFMKGNHEDRFPRFLAERCPELYGLINDVELFGLEGFEVVPYTDYASFGMIDIAHDFGYSGKHAHIRAAVEHATSIIHGHTHGAGVSYFGTGRSKKHVAISSGWLGSAPEADYCKRKHKERHWMHAVTTITLLSDGIAHCQLHPIINGTVVIDGVVY